jgi:hypothetical protein
MLAASPDADLKRSVRILATHEKSLLTLSKYVLVFGNNRC